MPTRLSHSCCFIGKGRQSGRSLEAADRLTPRLQRGDVPLSTNSATVETMSLGVFEMFLWYAAQAPIKSLGDGLVLSKAISYDVSFQEMSRNL